MLFENSPNCCTHLFFVPEHPEQFQVAKIAKIAMGDAAR